MIRPGDFYEDDEPIEDLLRAFDNGTPVVTGRTVEELAAEQGITGPQPLDSLRSEVLDEDERAEFVRAYLDDRQSNGWFCEHYTITASFLTGTPTTGCGCTLLPLAG